MCDRSHLSAETRLEELRSQREALFDRLNAVRAGSALEQRAGPTPKIKPGSLGHK